MKWIDFLNPYAYLMLLRRFLYRSGVLTSHHVSAPVISIGNVSTGGTGKTPMTILITRYIQPNHKLRVAIVLRGYKRQSTGTLVVSRGEGMLTSVKESGDEAALIAQSLPGAIVI